MMERNEFNIVLWYEDDQKNLCSVPLNLQSCCQQVRYSSSRKVVINEKQFLNVCVIKGDDLAQYQKWLQYIERCGVNFRRNDLNEIIFDMKDYKTPIEMYYNFIMWRLFYDSISISHYREIIDNTLMIVDNITKHKRILSPIFAVSILYKNSINMDGRFIAFNGWHSGDAFSIYQAPKLSDMKFAQDKPLRNNFIDVSNKLGNVIKLNYGGGGGMQTTKFADDLFQDVDGNNPESILQFYKRYINLKPINI